MSEVTVEVTAEELQAAEMGLMQLRQEAERVTVNVARQEGIVLFLRGKLGDEKAEGESASSNDEITEQPETG